MSANCTSYDRIGGVGTRFIASHGSGAMPTCVLPPGRDKLVPIRINLKNGWDLA